MADAPRPMLTAEHLTSSILRSFTSVIVTSPPTLPDYLAESGIRATTLHAYRVYFRKNARANLHALQASELADGVVLASGRLAILAH